MLWASARLGSSCSGLAEVGHGAVEVAAQAQGVAQVVAGHGEVRLEPQRLAELGDGLLGPALGEQTRPRLLAASAIVRLEPQGGAAAVGGAVELAQAAVGFGQVGVVGGLAGVAGDGPADQLGGAAVVALLQGDDAEQVQGVGVLGLGCQDVAVQPGRFLEAATLVFLQAEGKFVAHGAALRHSGKKQVGEPIAHRPQYTRGKVTPPLR